MSWDINQVILVGRLAKDPELRYTQQGTPVCSFSIANNQGQESTSYFDIVTWNKQAENCSQYLSKGKQIAVNGRLSQRKWQDQNGQNRYKIEIIANTVQFLGSSGGSSDNYNDYDNAPMPDEVSSGPAKSFEAEPQPKSIPPQQTPKAPVPQQAPQQAPQSTSENQSVDDFSDSDDDIPF